MPIVTVAANDIDPAGLALVLELPRDFLDRELADAELKSTAQGRLDARLSRSGDDIVVRGHLVVDLTTPCARCLEPAPVHVDTELALLLQPAKEVSYPHVHPRHAGKKNGKTAPRQGTREPEYEFSSEEAELDTYDGETVVLDSFIREAILLEIPNFPLCSDACPGIGAAAPEPPPPTKEPSVDPRLAPLEALSAKLAAKEKRPSSPKARATPKSSKKKKKE